MAGLLGSGVRDWPRRRLREIAAIYSGGTPSTEDPGLWGGDIPWVTPGELTGHEQRYISATEQRITRSGLNGSGATLLPPGSLLVTTRATLGARTVAQVPIATNQGFKNLVLDKKVADAGFYYHLIGLLTPEMERRASGTTFPEISATQFGDIEVPVPPLQDQRRITQILDLLDEELRTLQAQSRKMELMAYGCMLDWFPDVASGVQGWHFARLEECVAAPITYGIVQAGPHISGGVPYIRTGDMASSRLSLDGLLRTSPHIASRYQRSRVRSGEIVCAIRATVGKVLPVPAELDGANLTQGTARISPASGISADYLLWALRSPSVQKQFMLAVKGTTFAEITLRQLRQLKVPVPAGTEAQAKIARLLNAAHARVDECGLQIAKLRLVKRGLMDDLLTGRVRATGAGPERAGTG